jgi:cellulose synthase/poly-beta-1,6-N-acetylglucosamine synthase-like glycosyltransferase
MRAFVAARIGWDAIGGTLIISGAFGVFRRSVVAAAGGFDADTVGEDMELVVRLHDHLREQRQPYRISFVPDPVAWTEAPESLRDLGRQRDRWQRGLLQVLWRHRRMFASPAHGVPGMVAFPFFVFVELLGPVVEVLGYAVFAATMLLGWGSAAYAGAFVMLAIVLGSLISTFAVVLQELSFSRYRSNREVLRLVGLAMVEGLGYRQLTLWWRLRGLISGLRRDSAWGPMQRKGFGDTVPMPAPEDPERSRAA